jgi:hypothetical protein
VPVLTGADGNGTGVVDQGDYNVWRTNFGDVLGAGSVADTSASHLATDADVLDQHSGRDAAFGLFAQPSARGRSQRSQPMDLSSPTDDLLLLLATSLVADESDEVATAWERTLHAGALHASDESTDSLAAQLLPELL